MAHAEAAKTRKKYVQRPDIAVAITASANEARSSQGAATLKTLSTASGSSQRCSQPSVERLLLSRTLPSRPSMPFSAVTTAGSSASYCARQLNRSARASSSAPQSAKNMESAAAAHMGTPQPACPTA